MRGLAASYLANGAQIEKRQPRVVVVVSFPALIEWVPPFHVSFGSREHKGVKCIILRRRRRCFRDTKCLIKKKKTIIIVFAHDPQLGMGDDPSQRRGECARFYPNCCGFRGNESLLLPQQSHLGQQRLTARGPRNDDDACSLRRFHRFFLRFLVAYGGDK